jgi:hypothetical protein
MEIYFSDYFKVRSRAIDRYGAFNISLLGDLPLFIDPFLLFNSKKRVYRALHDDIIQYLRFLRKKSVSGTVPRGLVDAWYRFPEVRQTWLGFSDRSNRGHGLGTDFAEALNHNLYQVFRDFGKERVTHGSHLEKLCLIKDGVGRDTISDFTTNLILGYLCDYTQTFATQYIEKRLRRRVRVAKVRFNYDTESWQSDVYDLPRFKTDFVLLVPRNMLTKDDTWINKTDMVGEFDEIADSITDAALRAQVNNYFLRVLPKDAKPRERREAAQRTILEYPGFVDHYIRYKEDRGDRAESLSSRRVSQSKTLYVDQYAHLANLLAAKSGFYEIGGDTYEESLQRVAYLKDVVENKGGYRIFYVDGHPLEREKDVHILFKLTWFATSSDVTSEADDGRGPVDFKVSRGSRDKTLVEFKLAKNTRLRQNLAGQTEAYQKASGAKKAIKVIVYFSKKELKRVTKILRELKLHGRQDIILIDARNDNKPSGSRA